VQSRRGGRPQRVPVTSHTTDFNTYDGIQHCDSNLRSGKHSCCVLIILIVNSLILLVWWQEGHIFHSIIVIYV